MRISRDGVVSAAGIALLLTGIALLLNGALMAFAIPHLPSALPDRELKTMRAGWWKCQAAATACKKCVPAGGSCGTGTTVNVPPAPPISFCALQTSFGHPGCENASAVRHCVFSCTPASCAQKQNGSDDCGEFQTLAGFAGCEFAGVGNPCTVSACTNSGGSGQYCFECQ